MRWFRFKPVYCLNIHWKTFELYVTLATNQIPEWWNRSPWSKAVIFTRLHIHLGNSNPSTKKILHPYILTEMGYTTTSEKALSFSHIYKHIHTESNVLQYKNEPSERNFLSQIISNIWLMKSSKSQVNNDGKAWLNVTANFQIAFYIYITLIHALKLNFLKFVIPVLFDQLW